MRQQAPVPSLLIAVVVLCAAACSDKSLPVSPVDTTGTGAPAGTLVFASVSTGFMHACGVTTAGAAYCWGDNSSGELGVPGDSSTTPVPVPGGLHFASVSAGVHHTCGVTTSGAAYCWGLRTPVGPLPVPGGLTFTSVSVGFVHACGVTTSGAAYCWGEGFRGELGDGAAHYSDSPVPVAGGLTFREVSAGMNHSCGVTTSGAAYCWGMNALGELGTGTSAGPGQCELGDSSWDYAAPLPASGLTQVPCSLAPVPVAGGLTFATVSAGGWGTCGVTTSGTAYCWGDDRLGLLGSDPATGPAQCESLWGDPAGFVACGDAPVAVPGGLHLAVLSASQEDAGACGLTSTGVAYCWGNVGNLIGGLWKPVALAGGHAFATLSTGDINSCGVTSAGVAYCWGVNQYGQLGDGTTAESWVPVKVAGQP